jgi:hypothetical protein
LAFRDREGVHLQSRQLRDLTAGFPEVAAAVAQLGDVVLDGELVVWRAGRFDFAALQDRLRSGPKRVSGLMATTPAAFTFSTCSPTAVTTCTGGPMQRGAASWRNCWAGPCRLDWC